MKFNSKKDLWLGLLLWIPMLIGVLAVLLTPGYMSKIIFSLVIILVAWIWFGTEYYVGDGLLKTKCGPFKETIKIESIRSIKKTRTPLSSAALSMDRLEVKHGKYGYTIISPIDKQVFIDEIKKYNDNIDIQL